MNRPAVFRTDESWWALLRHDGWDDLTPFETWEAAIDHALWLGFVGGGRR